MSNIKSGNIMDVYLKMVDFGNDNYINVIKFKSIDLIQHIIDNSILENENENDLENKNDLEIEIE
jgi:hypothetical protein